MVSFSWERLPCPCKNVLKFLYQDGANGAHIIAIILICVHKKCVTKHYKLELYNSTFYAVNKFCSKECDKRVLIKYFG